MTEEIENPSYDSFDEQQNGPKKLRVKTIDLKLGLIYPELPTKFYAQNALPRPKNPKPASVLAWLLYSNKMFLNTRWFEDHNNLWAKSALVKLTPVTRFYHFLSLIRPTIHRSWYKVAWAVIRLIFVVLIVVGLVGTVNSTRLDTWEGKTLTILLATGLGFTCLNLILLGGSYWAEDIFNKHWDPRYNKRFLYCLEELVAAAQATFNVDILRINIYSILYDEGTVAQKTSKKTKKAKEKIDKAIPLWMNKLEQLTNEATKRVKKLEINCFVQKVHPHSI